MSLPALQKIKISGDVLSQEVSGETVLLDLASEQYFGLDHVGTRFWSFLNEGKTLDEIVKLMTDEFEVTTAQLEQDLEDLLAQLADAGLVTLLPDGVD